MRCLITDPQSGLLRDYHNTVAIETAATPSEVTPLLNLIAEKCQKDGVYAACFISYEAAPAFDPCYSVKEYRSLPHPLVVCGLFTGFDLITADTLRKECLRESCDVSSFIPELDFKEYCRNFDHIREYLRQGETYQVNATFRLTARYWGNPLVWFAQRSTEAIGLSATGFAKNLGYPAYFDMGDYHIASLSPELFFSLSAIDSSGDGTRNLVMKPMKGTAKPVPGKEAACAEALFNDKKNRAENLMIVDMIRNDCGRIAEPGSVQVSELFSVECYRSVLQMTSTVLSKTKKSFPEVLSASFPCASITGAPKIRSMDIISQIEGSPRGIYTGTICSIDPDGSAACNVAIRTACFDESSHRVTYGTGGGITWQSDVREEWNECLLKTVPISSDFYVFDSLLLKDGTYSLLSRHLFRFLSSIRFFSIIDKNRSDEEIIQICQECLAVVAHDKPDGIFKVKLIARVTDGISAYAEVLRALSSPCPIALSKQRVHSSNPFLAHKTSIRHMYTDALAGLCGVEDVLLINERGELTETTRANIVLELDGSRFTPPLNSGLLPGVLRADLLDRGELHEQTLYKQDYLRATRVFLINSIRGFVECLRMDQ